MDKQYEQMVKGVREAYASVGNLYVITTKAGTQEEHGHYTEGGIWFAGNVDAVAGDTILDKNTGLQYKVLDAKPQPGMGGIIRTKVLVERVRS